MRLPWTFNAWYDDVVVADTDGDIFTGIKIFKNLIKIFSPKIENKCILELIPMSIFYSRKLTLLHV